MLNSVQFIGSATRGGIGSEKFDRPSERIAPSTRPFAGLCHNHEVSTRWNLAPVILQDQQSSHIAWRLFLAHVSVLQGVFTLPAAGAIDLPDPVAIIRAIQDLLAF